MRILQVHPGDYLARNAVRDVLNRHHDKRIKQKTLDFYRTTFINALNDGGSVIFLVGFDDDGVPIAISAIANVEDGKYAKHSITVVDSTARKKGLGKKILSAKMNIFRNISPSKTYRGYVNKNNEQSIKMCSSVGLIISGEGARDRGEDREPTEFFIFEDA